MIFFLEILISSFETFEVGELLTLEYGKPLKKESRSNSGYPVYGSNGIIGHHNEFIVEGPCIVVGRKGSAGALNFSEENAVPIAPTVYENHKKRDIKINTGPTSWFTGLEFEKAHGGY